ncbi:hypothetical protein [uncultured Butyricimonas sp.]|uniref:hypothetical protein n=1 Tax=uncultured Butyricimonas sp. TaxID=1268785 RepID=UPI0026DCAC21|nr:hypothetical protein [uncultured Butyricimonas sp.]
MKTKSYIVLLFCIMAGMYSCYDDDSTLGRNNVSKVSISAAYDTLTTYFGEELVVNHVKVEQSGEELPLTYEWAYGELNMSSGALKPYPIKDTLHVVSTELELNYAFRKLGTFGLRLKVDNGETTEFKYFVLQIDTEYAEGITMLSKNSEGKGRLSFMKTLTREEISAGKEPYFQDDIMEVCNPDMELKNVTDMIQHDGRLMISSGSDARIYNMDSRTFGIEMASSFAARFPNAALQQFIGISSQDNMHVYSSDGRAYVYETMLDELLVLDAFADLDVDAGIPYNKPVFVNYENSTYYIASTSKYIVTSGSNFADLDIIQTCFIGTNLYIFATRKDDPSKVYIGRTTSSSFGKPTAANMKEYTATGEICMDRNSILVGVKPHTCVYYTYKNAIYRYKPYEELPTQPVITVPDGMEIKTLSLDPDHGYLYVGVYEKNSTETLKGSLYIYDTENSRLVETHKNIGDEPVTVIYKERV